MTTSDTPATRLATRLAFLVAGFGVAAWAPLVPFAKARLGATDAALGLLLLCLAQANIGAQSAAVENRLAKAGGPIPGARRPVK